MEAIAVNGISLLKGPKDCVNPASATQDENISRWTSLPDSLLTHAQNLSRCSNISKQYRWIWRGKILANANQFTKVLEFCAIRYIHTCLHLISLQCLLLISSKNNPSSLASLHTSLHQLWNIASHISTDWIYPWKQDIKSYSPWLLRKIWKTYRSLLQVMVCS